VSTLTEEPASILRPYPSQRMPKGSSMQERLLAYSRVDGKGCWRWIGAIDAGGYGKVACSDSRSGRGAHRMSYLTFVGPIDDGMTVDHLCFVPDCINPAHLRLLTEVENERNQRSAFARHCRRGHEFTDENTMRSPGKGRQCRACHNARNKTNRQAYNEQRHERAQLAAVLGRVFETARAMAASRPAEAAQIFAAMSAVTSDV
jgi:hypothetical protein